MKKNYILAFVLSFGILMGWQYFMTKTHSRPSTETAPATTSSIGNTPPSDITAPAAPTVQKSSVMVFDFGNHRVSINRFGGAVAQWEIQENGRWLSLVPEKEFSTQSLATFPDVEFAVSRDGQNIRMVAQRSDGLKAEKLLALAPTGYVHRISLSLTNASGSPLAIDAGLGWGPGVEAGDEGGKDGREAKGFQRALVFADGKSRRIKEGSDSGAFTWWGVDGHYFLAAFLNSHPGPITVAVSKSDHYFSLRQLLPVTLAAGENRRWDSSFYLGPKGYESLKSLGLGLESSVDFGYFAPFGRIIHRALFLFHKVTGNYGWAIITLTFIIQVLVLPLTVKSFQHAQKMKAVQPQMKRLQELYKNDTRRLNSEMLALYQRHGLRFMGMEGCVPMLIQLPVFWALFSTLRNTFELRHAPWIGWVKDLSIHDPIYLLPILMGAGMFVQQKMTVNASDPTQKQMMYMMPVIFTFFFLKMPSGLVIYWLTNSLLTIAVQWFLMRRVSSVEVIKSAEKR